jgi:hypothetical protein
LGKKLLGSVLRLKDIRARFPRAKKGDRVYVREEKAFYFRDEGEWLKERDADFAYLITKAAKEFGWTPEQTLTLTPNELAALFGNLARVNYESAFYTALAFNDPEKISSALNETVESELSDREKNANGMKRLREVVKQWR